MTTSKYKKELIPFLYEDYNGDLLHNKSFGYYIDKVMPLADELNAFLEGDSWCRSMDFVRKTLFPYEIKYNNAIEDYKDPIALVNNYAQGSSNKKNDYSTTTQQQRIINLARGYNYVLRGKRITSINLAKLYEILSEGILDQEDRLLSGHTYRHDEVAIHCSEIIWAQPEAGVKAKHVEPMMSNLLAYANEPTNKSDVVDTFIRSQLLHYQFVYIHPYFDVNGRTARTMGIWYLLNNEAFPFILFNRAIHYDKPMYYQVIKETKKYRNATYFLKYMLNNVMSELEKEYAIRNIQESIGSELSIEDRQMLQYMLTNKGNDSVLDLTSFYNRFNPKRKPQHIFENMIEPLIDKGVVQVTGYSKKQPGNAFLSFNPSTIATNPQKVKRLNLSSKCARL